MSSRITAMDVENQEFSRKMRGYEPEEVRLYLKSVGAEVERLNLENSELHEKMGKLSKENEEHRKREQTLQQTLITAQKMAEDLDRKARGEADLLMQQARHQSERVLQESQDQLARLEAEISRCKLEKELFEKRLRHTVDEHLTLLDQRSDDQANGESHLRVLRTAAKSDVG